MSHSRSSGKAEAGSATLTKPREGSRRSSRHSAPEHPSFGRHAVIDTGCDARFLDQGSRNRGVLRTVRLDLSRQLVSPKATGLVKASAVLFGLHTSRGKSSIDVIKQLRARDPHLGIYLLVHSVSEVASRMTELAEAGVDEVFCIESRADQRACEHTVRARLASPAPETEVRLLWKWFRDSPERSLVMHCVRNGFRLDDWSVRARLFAACRKTIQNRVTEEGLPSPGMIARCGRVLHAQELERRGYRPTSAIARLLEFPSASAMQRTRRRLRKSLMTRGRGSLVFASLIR